MGDLRLHLGPLQNCYSGPAFFPLLTTKVEGFEGCLDYVFYWCGDRDYLVREALLDVPYTSESMIPNEKHPSDHYPVGVIFRLYRSTSHGGGGSVAAEK
ncbi:unnamed protein product [Amoebophrya sp. A25]|nr:unnamed protein product [Amoebophrya sp. A25]|eukprot:GSA25T00021939001.1